MDREEKLGMLQGLSEADLRKNVLIPLFRKMGFNDVIEYHGGGAEKGKDIIYYTIDGFGDKEYTGVVVKIGDITGSVSSSMGAKNILFQVEQTLQEEYTDVYNFKKLKIDKCIVVTNGSIKNTAMESICGKLEGANLNRLVTFIDGDKLVTLIDKNWKEYFWSEYENFNAYFKAMQKQFTPIAEVTAIGQKEPVPLDKMVLLHQREFSPPRGRCCIAGVRG